MQASSDGLTKRLSQIVKQAGGPSAVARMMQAASGGKGAPTPAAIGGWARGAVPLLEHQVALCDALGKNYSWLATGHGEEDMHEPPRDAESMREDTPGAQEDDDLAQVLAELILGFSELPSAYEAMALARIQDHYTEFRRRALMRSAIRSPQGTKYPARKPTGKTKR